MITHYKSFSIEIIDETDSELNEFELETIYQNHYPKDILEIEGIFKPTSMHAVKVSTNGVEIANALLSEMDGRTTISNESFVIKDNELFIICSSYMYCLNLEDLSCKWRKNFDWATCFGVYEFNNSMIVHGESTITMFNTKGTIIWTFTGNDIFISPNTEESFRIHNKKIHLIDFSGKHYILDANGKITH